MSARSLGSVLALSTLLATWGAAAEDGTWRVSVDSSGNEGDDTSSFGGSISGDGRFVAFNSWAGNLVPGDSNGAADVFVHDRRTQVTTLVSVDSSGAQGNSASLDPSISDDGRFVAFLSWASNLVPGDTNGVLDVFVHDRATGTTVRASVSSSGVQGDDHCAWFELSGDGRVVAFQSSATNLVPFDTNGSDDVFIRDLTSRVTSRVSVDSRGAQTGGGARPSVSFDGRFVSFDSSASDLVPNDTNGWNDVFVHDRATGATTLVSVDSSGGQATGDCWWPSISEDGQLVAFESWAVNLVPADTNASDDVFVHDRGTARTTRVSLDSSGGEGNDWSDTPVLSGDGQIVFFRSNATNLVQGDTNGTWDVMRHDRRTGETTRASVDSSGREADGSGHPESTTADGRLVEFFSAATNLVSGDTNDAYDVFVHGEHLILEAIPETVSTGSALTLDTWTGAPLGAALLAVVDLNGAPTFVVASIGNFDSAGLWSVSGTVPANLSGNVLTFQVYGFEPSGAVGMTNREKVTFQ